MQPQLRARSLRWILRGGLAGQAAVAALRFGRPCRAGGAWSAPVKLPGPCGSSVAENQAGAMAAGGTSSGYGITDVQG